MIHEFIIHTTCLTSLPVLESSLTQGLFFSLEPSDETEADTSEKLKTGVPQLGNVPDFIDQSRIKEEKCGFMDTSLSDKHTNRFYASKIHDILHKKYEWTWRLSPDGKLTEK